jgi:hypothetical protein
MTENQEEGNFVETGGAPANVQPSTLASQPSPVDIPALVAEIRTLKGEVNALKSGKDKAVSRLMKPLEEIAKRLGVDEETVQKAQREMVLDELVAQRIGNSQPQGGTGTTPEPTAQVDVQSIAKQYGLDPVADAAFMLSLVKETNPDTVELHIARKAKEKAGQPNPTPSQVPAPQGGGNNQATGDELVGEYRQKMIAARGKPDLLRSIKADYAKKGVPVDNVIFS